MSSDDRNQDFHTSVSFALIMGAPVCGGFELPHVFTLSSFLWAKPRVTCHSAKHVLKFESTILRSFRMNLPKEEEIRAALREVNDPELGINIVDLGLIYGIDVSGAGVFIKMTMTTPACPLHAYLSQASESAIRSRFPDVSAVHIELVWEPPWDPAKMSQAARKQLGWSA
jgi:metal-sulfur cluster biosynthetic enzyme